jgi:TM2 domain-containing membrane protein YozV
MSEISLSENVSGLYQEEFLEEISKEETGKVAHLDPSKLSSCDYKTQVLFVQFLGLTGAADFYAGRPLIGTVKLAVSCLSWYTMTPVVMGVAGMSGLLFVAHDLFLLSIGEYRDSDYKVIRQITHLKQDEVSSVNHRTAWKLNLFLGLIGAHHFYVGRDQQGVVMFCIAAIGLKLLSKPHPLVIVPFIFLLSVYLHDLYQLSTCGFRDYEGKVVCPSYVKAEYGISEQA